MKGASPPTDRKARTGEFTPPGIMLSARCCSFRDCSVFRDVVDGIQSSRQGETRRQQMVRGRQKQSVILSEPREAPRCLRRNQSHVWLASLSAPPATNRLL